MKFSVLLGVLAGFFVMWFVNFSEGDPVAAMLNTEAAVIVLGGCLTAAICHFQIHGVLRALRRTIWLIKPPRNDLAELVERMAGWARSARREGILSLEQKLDDIGDDLFLRDGLQLVVDGAEVDALRAHLHTRIETDRKDNEEPGAFWDAVGGYSPTLGVLGAVMGLIHVMLHLGASGGTAALGAGIATAFTATMYGVGFANLFFIPIGKRLSAVADERALFEDMATEGLVLVASGANPRTIETHLANYISRLAVGKKQAEGESEDTVTEDPVAEGQ